MTPRTWLLLAPLLATPLAAQTPPLSQDQLVARLGQTLDSLTAADAFSGVVVLAKQGTTVFQQAYGWADRAARRPNNLETAFNLGSVNKMFTATAIRQLERVGKLALDSTLGHYWP